MIHQPYCPSTVDTAGQVNPSNEAAYGLPGTAIAVSGV